MRARFGLFMAATFVAGVTVGLVVGRVLPNVSGSGVVDTCREMAEEVSTKCHEADRWHTRVEKKYPNPENNEQALKSREWERSMSWSQACDDAKEQLTEAILAAPEPVPRASPE